MERFRWFFGGSLGRSYMKYTPLITDECNLSCTYCFQKYKGQGSVMTKEVLRKFIDGVFTKEAPRQLHDDIFIQFCGGEALLYPELIDYAMDYMKETYLPFESKPVRINVLSNGTTISNPKVRELLEKHTELGVSISIDGDKENHNKCRGSFDEVIKNIHYIKELFVRTNRTPRVSMTVSPDNLDGFVRGFKFLTGDVGVKEVWVSITLGDQRWAEDEFAGKLFLALLEIVDYMTLPENCLDVWTNLFDRTLFDPVSPCAAICSSITSQICCTPEGNLTPCYVFRNQTKIDYSIGNVNSWVDTSKKTNVCTNTIQNTKGLEDCLTCDIGKGCKRCGGYFAEEYGEMRKGDTVFCKIHHAKYWAFQYLVDKRWELVRNDKQQPK